MNKKALIAALVLGSSSVAMAAPVTVTAKASFTASTAAIVRDHREPARPPAKPIVVKQPAPIVRDHRDGRWNHHPIIQQPVRYQPVVYQPVVYQPYRPQWSTIASGVNFGTDGRAFIHMYDKGAFRTIQLSAPAGGMVVREVAIEFTDKTTQVLRNLNQVVDAAHPLTIDLDGNLRTVNTVVVYGPKGGTNPGIYGCSEVTLSAI